MLAGAAATLTGLVFVAVSINLSRVLSTTGLAGRAGESLMQLFGVVIISTTALIPQQPPVALGTEILVVASGLWLVQTVIQLRYLNSKTGTREFGASLESCRRNSPISRSLSPAFCCCAGHPLDCTGWRRAVFFRLP